MTDDRHRTGGGFIGRDQRQPLTDESTESSENEDADSGAASGGSNRSPPNEQPKRVYDKTKMLCLSQSEASLRRPAVLSTQFDTAGGLWSPDLFIKAHWANDANANNRRRIMNDRYRPPQQAAGIGIKIGGTSQQSSAANSLRSAPRDTPQLSPQRRSFAAGSHTRTEWQRTGQGIQGRAPVTQNDLRAANSLPSQRERVGGNASSGPQPLMSANIRLAPHEIAAADRRVQNMNNKSAVHVPQRSGNTAGALPAWYADSQDGRYNNKPNSWRNSALANHPSGQAQRQPMNAGANRLASHNYNQNNYGHQQHNDSNPEWMADGPESMFDTIELHGFEDDKASDEEIDTAQAHGHLIGRLSPDRDQSSVNRKEQAVRDTPSRLTDSELGLDVDIGRLLGLNTTNQSPPSLAPPAKTTGGSRFSKFFESNTATRGSDSQMLTAVEPSVVRSSNSGTGTSTAVHDLLSAAPSNSHMAHTHLRSLPDNAVTLEELESRMRQTNNNMQPMAALAANENQPTGLPHSFSADQQQLLLAQLHARTSGLPPPRLPGPAQLKGNPLQDPLSQTQLLDALQRVQAIQQVQQQTNAAAAALGMPPTSAGAGNMLGTNGNGNTVLQNAQMIQTLLMLQQQGRLPLPPQQAPLMPPPMNNQNMIQRPGIPQAAPVRAFSYPPPMPGSMPSASGSATSITSAGTFNPLMAAAAAQAQAAGTPPIGSPAWLCAIQQLVAQQQLQSAAGNQALLNALQTAIAQGSLPPPPLPSQSQQPPQLQQQVGGTNAMGGMLGHNHTRPSSSFSTQQQLQQDLMNANRPPTTSSSSGVGGLIGMPGPAALAYNRRPLMKHLNLEDQYPMGRAVGNNNQQQQPAMYNNNANNMHMAGMGTNTGAVRQPRVYNNGLQPPPLPAKHPVQDRSSTYNAALRAAYNMLQNTPSALTQPTRLAEAITPQQRLMHTQAQQRLNEQQPYQYRATGPSALLNQQKGAGGDTGSVVQNRPFYAYNAAVPFTTNNTRTGTMQHTQASASSSGAGLADPSSCGVGQSPIDKLLAAARANNITIGYADSGTGADKRATGLQPAPAPKVPANALRADQLEQMHKREM